MTIKTELTLLLVEDDKQASKEMIACAGSQRRSFANIHNSRDGVSGT